MARTFLPTLIGIVKLLCRYITRYNETLRDNLTTAQLVPYEQLREACQAFLDIVDVPVNP